MPKLIVHDSPLPIPTATGSLIIGPRSLRSGRSLSRASSMSAMTSRASPTNIKMNGGGMQTRSRARIINGSNANTSTNTRDSKNKSRKKNPVEVIKTEATPTALSGASTSRVQTSVNSDRDVDDTDSVVRQVETANMHVAPETVPIQTLTSSAMEINVTGSSSNDDEATLAPTVSGARSRRSPKRARLDCVNIEHSLASEPLRKRKSVKSRSAGSNLNSFSRTDLQKKRSICAPEVNNALKEYDERQSYEAEVLNFTERNALNSAAISSQDSVTSSPGAGPGPSSRTTRSFQRVLQSPSPTPFSAAPPPSSPACTTPTPTPGPSQLQSQSQSQSGFQPLYPPVLPTSPILRHKLMLPEEPTPVRTPEPEPLSAYQCPICFTPPTNATLTPCGHVCCGECLFTAVRAALQRSAVSMVADAAIARCPVCRAPLRGWDGRGGGVIGLKPRTIISL